MMTLQDNIQSERRDNILHGSNLNNCFKLVTYIEKQRNPVYRGSNPALGTLQSIHIYNIINWAPWVV